MSLFMQCVSTVWYLIVHGDKKMGHFLPTRGLRQGDPISPYLFLICTEGFSKLTEMKEDRGQIWGCRVTRNAQMVIHMSFTDDCYVFCRANKQLAQRIVGMLNKF